MTSVAGARTRSLTKAALLASAASFALFGAASAQTKDIGPSATAGPVKDAPISEIVVTGTSIRGVAPVGSAMNTISRDDIKASGAISVTQLLQQSPQVANVGVSEQSRGNTGGASNITFGSSINIRGISPYATLTLIDGHRMVQQEARAETVDPSHIPTNMLQRVEIVADGGSAIYGSEAIAGVANLILRRHVEGAEASVRYGASNVDYDENVEQFTIGHSWSTGQFTAGFEHMHKSNFAQSELPYDTRLQAPFGGTDIRQTSCNPATVQIGTTFYAVPAGGVTAANANQFLPGTNLCEPYKTADAVPKQERSSFAFTFDQDITSKLHFNLEGYVSRRQFRIITAPFTETVTVPSTNAFYVAPAGVTVPLCSAGTNATFGTPAGTRCLTVLYNFAKDVGTDHSSSGFSRVYESTAGLTYDLPHKWLASATYTYGFDTDRNYDRGYDRINAANQNIALASSDPNKALNLFGGASNPSVVSNTSSNGIFNQLFDTGGHTIMQAENLKLDGPLFDLPGGAIRAAVGFQHYDFLWWSNNATGPLTAPLYAGPQHVHRKVDSYYGELNIPLIGGDFQFPLVQKLELNIAGRVDDYSDLGKTSNPKIGLRYQPIHGLVFHTSYGTSFRSPNVLDLYQNSQNININSFADPKAGGATVIAISQSGGNPGIKPETATTYSFGADYNPDFLPRLNVGLNYFALKLSNQIAAFLTDSTILSKEDQLAGTGVITRVTSLAQVQSILATHTVTSGALPADLSLIKVIIDGRPQNLGRTYAAGVDVNATYKIPTDRYGNFVAGVIGEYFTQYKDQATINSAKVNRLNTIFYPPRWRARYFVNWNMGDWSATATVNYLNPYTNTLVTPTQKVDATVTTDLHVAYQIRGWNRWTKDMTVSLDLDNVFDQDPPHVLGQGTGVLGTGNTSNFGGAGYDPTKADVYGRLISVTVSKRF